jgi:hypothetical protein
MAGGRPTVYRPEYAEMARNACAIGATNATLAERFGVSRTTIDNWIARIPDFSNAVKRGREIADAAVVSALYARAKGMERKLTKVFCHEGRPVVLDYTEQVLPNVSACMFWLRNRRPQQWRENRRIVDDKTKVDVRTDVSGPAAERKAAAHRGDAGADRGQTTAPRSVSQKRSGCFGPIGGALAEIALIAPTPPLPRPEQPPSKALLATAAPFWAGSPRWSAMCREAKLAAGRDVSPGRPDRYAGCE